VTKVLIHARAIGSGHRDFPARAATRFQRGLHRRVPLRDGLYIKRHIGDFFTTELRAAIFAEHADRIGAALMAMPHLRQMHSAARAHHFDFFFRRPALAT